MMKPEITEKQRLFIERTGTWVGEEQMAPSEHAPDGMNAQGRSESRLAAGGFALVADYSQSMNKQVMFRGLSVTAWDPSEECYVLHWFDSMGSPPHIFKGQLEGDPKRGKLVLEGPAPGGGKQRLISEYPDPNTMLATAEMSKDGETWTKTMEATYKRQA